MCSFTDTQAAPSAYTVSSQQFIPEFWFWPVNITLNGTTLLVEQIGADPSAVASQGTKGVSIIAEQCQSAGVSRRRSPIWISCGTIDSTSGVGTLATVLQQEDAANNGPPVNSKGRINFGKSIVAPNDVITLQDSNNLKTLATAGERPTNDTGDMAIGLDQTGGLAQRSPTSISSYINAIPSGSNWLERLTSTAKIFKVPIATPAAKFSLSTTPLAAQKCRAQDIPMVGLTAYSILKWSYSNSPIGVEGYGTGALQISTFATADRGGVMVCNISGSTVIPGPIMLNIREEL